MMVNQIPAPETLALLTLTATAVAAVVLLVACGLIALLGHRLLTRLADLEAALEEADERFDAFVAILGGELGALKATGEGQLRRLERLGRQVEEVSVDIVRRDTPEVRDPRGAASARTDVVVAARGGQSVEQLVREHGVSADEAELLVMLHGAAAEDDAGAMR